MIQSSLFQPSSRKLLTTLTFRVAPDTVSRLRVKLAVVDVMQGDT
jgi:hypothetical protein